MAKLKSGTRIYGDATIDNKLQITSGPVLVGAATSTGTASQRLQVTGGAYVSGNTGIGTTNPQYILTVSDTGTPATVGLTNCLADFTTTANSYGQINLRNTSTGTNASSDIILTADNGNDSTNFIDLGINNSGYSVGSWTINGANDGYLYTSDGNLSIGAINASVAKYISFFTGGTLAANERLRVNSTGVGIGTTNPRSTLQVGVAITMYGPTGIVSATKYYGDGSSLTGITGGLSISTSVVPQFQYLSFVSGASTSILGISTLSQPLVFTPSTGNLGIGTTNPLQKLHVLGNLLVAAGSATTQHITQKAYELNNGTLSWEGTAGQLFSITNNLTSGSIFSVNDVSGIPSIDVDANGTVSMVSYGGSVGVGTTNPTQKLHVQGNVRITGGLYDSNNNVGTAGSVLSSTGSGLSWIAAASGGGGGISSVSISTNTTNQSQYLTYVTGTGSTTGFGVSLTGLVFNPSTNNLGIGTTNPTSKLQVVGDILVSGITTTTRLNVGTGGTIINTTSGGLVGIGTTNPTQKLDVVGNAYVRGLLSLPQNTVGVGFGTTTAIPQYGITQVMGDNDSWTIYGESPNGTNTGSLVIEVNDDNAEEKIVFRNRRNYSGAVIGVTTFLEMTTSANIMQQVPLLIGAATSTGTASQPLQVTGGAYVSGNIGIGTAAPAFKADIAGDARVTSTNKMRFGGTAGTTNFYMQYNSTTNSLDFVAG